MIKLLVGIPAYRRQVDIGHVYQIMQLCAASNIQDRVKLMGLCDVDSCSVDYARNILLHKAIKQGADWLLSIDSDTFWGNPAEVMRMIIEGDERRAAVIAAPVRRRKTNDFNAVEKIDGHERRLEAHEVLGKVRSVERIGTAFMGMRCGWFVRNWPDQPWFVSQHLTGPEPKKIGEDYSFCDGVIARGGQIYCDGRFEPIHVGEDHITVSAPTAKVEVAA